MAGLLVAFALLFALTAYFVARPLLSGDEGPDEGAPRAGEGLEPEERAVIERELRWRLEHDHASGRLDRSEYEAQIARLDARAGAAKAAGD